MEVLTEVNLVMILLTRFEVSVSFLRKAKTNSSSLITPSWKKYKYDEDQQPSQNIPLYQHPQPSELPSCVWDEAECPALCHEPSSDNFQVFSVVEQYSGLTSDSSSRITGERTGWMYKTNNNLCSPV